MLTTRRTGPIDIFDPASTPSPIETTAALLFDGLGALHGLDPDDRESLSRAAVGLRFIRSMGTYSTIEHELFGLALCELPGCESFVIESAACLAADRIALDPQRQWSRMNGENRRRVMWLAAILRLADALVGDSRRAIEGVYAAWTDETLYVEVDGVAGCEPEVVQARTAAIEAASGRRLVVTSSATRRSAVGAPAA